MSIFLSGNDRVRIALPNDDTNAIYIRPKMNLGQKNRVQGASVGIGKDGKTVLDIGAGNNALMEMNFVAWEGPKFEKEPGKLAPCDARHQQMLDPSDPLVVLALDEIGKRNRDPESPDPKGQEINTSSTDGITS